jgi:hypothetical protein
MIGRASHQIKQINDLVKELQDIKNPELDEKKVRLHAVSKSIETLAQTGVAIPSELITLQNQIRSEIKEFENPEEILLFMADELSKTIEEIRRNISGRNPTKSYTYKGRIDRNVPTTKRPELKRLLLEVLTEMNGRGSVYEILRRMETRLKGRLTPADLETLEDGEPRWQKNVQWLRFRMTMDGEMKKNSPRGIWELSNPGVRKN